MSDLDHWHTIEINGRRADVFEPPDALPERAAVFLHGHAGTTLIHNEAYSHELAKRRLRVICPHGGKAWWLPIVTDEFDPDVSPLDYLVTSIGGWIESNWHTTTPYIGLFGVSMGGQGVIQWSYRYARDYSTVVAISPIVDFDRLHGHGLPLDNIFKSPEEARQQTAILHLHPLNWPRNQLICCDPTDSLWFEGAGRLAGKLSSSGILFETDFQTTGGGHSWDYFNRLAPRVVDYLVRSLDKEAMRIF